MNEQSIAWISGESSAPLLIDSAVSIGQSTEQAEVEQTIQNWEQAVKTYEASLELRADEDPQFNHDLVKRKLEELKKQQEEQKQEQENKDQQDQTDQGSDSEQQKDQDQKSDEQKQSGQDSKPDDKQGQDKEQNADSKPEDQKDQEQSGEGSKQD